MTTVVLFHSALGRRPSILACAEQLRADGHVVHAPDLFGGRTFDDLQEGCAYRDEVGIPALTARAHEAVADLGEDLVYAGISMGAVPAELLAATRPGARGAILVQGALPLEFIGAGAWPQDLPVQLHVTERDPWVDPDDVDALIAAVPEHCREVHRYPGSGHVVMDDTYVDHDPEIAAAMMERMRTWLRSR